MTEFNGKVVADETQPRGSRLTVVGFVLLWIASLVFALEAYNLAVTKKFQVDFDPSFEILVAAFCFLLTVLGALLLWKGRRARPFRRPEAADRNANRAILGTSVLLAIVTIAMILVYGSNQAFLRQRSNYVRPAPRPDYTMGEFPTPAPARPIPTFSREGNYYAGMLMGAIDHLRVGNIRMHASADQKVVNTIQIEVQRVECLVPGDDGPAAFAVDDTNTWVYGPLPVRDGSFFADQETARVVGKVMTPELMAGTVYLVYRDPQSGQTCDLGAFEYNAFVVER